MLIKVRAEQTDVRSEHTRPGGRGGSQTHGTLCNGKIPKLRELREHDGDIKFSDLLVL